MFTIVNANTDDAFVTYSQIGEHFIPHDYILLVDGIIEEYGKFVHRN